jgi:glycosyltransferase 2 family protein
VAPRLRLVVLAGGLAMSLGLTYVVLRGIDFSRFWHALTHGHPEWLAPAFGVFALAYAVRLLRWSILFAPESRPRVRQLVRALLAGEFFTCLLPVARLGEVARIVVLYRAAGTSRAETAGTIVAERAYDAAALLLLLFVAVPFAPPVTWLRAAALALAAVGLAVAAALIVFNVFGSRPIGFMLRPFARLSGFSRDRTDLAAARILRGLRGLRSPRVAAAAFALSAGSWLCVAASYVLAMHVVDVHLGLDAGIVVAVATTFSLLVPGLPASVGLFEAATIVALKPFGVGAARALSAGIVIHVLTFAPFLVLGPLALRRVVLPRARDVVPPEAEAVHETDAPLDNLPRRARLR